MNIDLTLLTEENLRARQIVERLKFLQQAKTHLHMLDFSIGNRVTFQPQGRPTLFGVVVRFNQKTVTVLTESGEQWRVAPSLLSRIFDVKEVQVADSKDPSVLQLDWK
jgi:hypothetical protein